LGITSAEKPETNNPTSVPPAPIIVIRLSKPARFFLLV
jgi:hypothetical protein